MGLPPFSMELVRKSGFEGLAIGPGGGIDGLAVIVGVKDDGAASVRGGEFAKNNGATSGDGEQVGFDAAGFEHGHEMLGVFLDVGGVAGDIGDGEKFGELAHDAIFAVHAIVADFLNDLGGIEVGMAFGRRDELRGSDVREGGGKNQQGKKFQ